MSDTAPVKSVLTLPSVSRAVTRTENGIPAVFAATDKAVEPPDMVTANEPSAPGATTNVDDATAEEIPDADAEIV